MADDGNDDQGAVDDFALPLDGSEQQDDGTEVEQPAPEGEDGGSQLPQDLVQAIQREGLHLVPGETPTDAYARLNFHLTRKTAEYAKKMARQRDDAVRREESLREQFTPMLRDFYTRQRQEQVELQAAQIPERGTPEYQTWLIEESFRREEARRTDEWRRMEQQRVDEANSEVAQQLRQIDAQGYAKVAQALGDPRYGGQPDPEFVAAYDVFSGHAVAAAQAYFPDAEPEKIHEFVALSQQLDIRRAEMNGVDFRDVLKGRFNSMISALEQRGYVVRPGQATAAPAGPNGQQRRVAPAPPTTAQRVSADAAAGARRAPTAVQSSSRPSSLPGQLPDPAAFDTDDDYIEAALDGILGSEKQRVGMHEKQR
jgi:hypothetical protein